MTVAITDLPDPTRPASFQFEDEKPIFVEEIEVSPGNKISWKVSAIRISDKDRTAIVNDKLIRVGDVVGPARIVEINPLSVVLDYEKKKLIVRLFNNQIRKEYKNSK